MHLSTILPTPSRQVPRPANRRRVECMVCPEVAFRPLPMGHRRSPRQVRRRGANVAQRARLLHPQAFADIYLPASKGLELFPKTDFQDRGANLGGIVREEDPMRHREVARKVLPAFSAR